MPNQTVSMKLPRDAWDALRAAFDDAGYAFRSVDHAAWQARGDCIATLYRSGKLVLQGAVVEPWVVEAEELGGRVTKRSGDAPSPVVSSRNDASGSPFGAALAKLPEPQPRAWIGIDEAGKGDYFGPLVVAAARVELEQLPLLAELGVSDSKRINDRRIHEMAAELKHVVPHQLLVLMPTKYNELYSKIGNLNRLLAWAHATCAENLLEQGVAAELILSDQFAKADLITPRLKARGSRLRFTQRTRAEEDPAVGCASIFARAAFLDGLASLEKRVGVPLAKGAGNPVLRAGRDFVRSIGAERLAEVAKLHFKTTKALV